MMQRRSFLAMLFSAPLARAVPPFVTPAPAVPNPFPACTTQAPDWRSMLMARKTLNLWADIPIVPGPERYVDVYVDPFPLVAIKLDVRYDAPERVDVCSHSGDSAYVTLGHGALELRLSVLDPGTLFRYDLELAVVPERDATMQQHPNRPGYYRLTAPCILQAVSINTL